MFFDKILTKIFGTANERLLKRLRPIVIEISAMEPEIKKLSDEELKAKTVEFRARIAARLRPRGRSPTLKPSNSRSDRSRSVAPCHSGN